MPSEPCLADQKQPHAQNILNIAAYKFVQLESQQLAGLKATILQKALELELKGSVLLATEGINLYLAGLESAIEQFIAFLEDDYPYFSGMMYKRSWSEYRPYTRMLVRLKQETISFGVDSVKPLQHTAPHLHPETLKDWYDAGKKMTVLDTRNNYEVECGTFADATHFNIRTFKQFIAQVDAMDDALKDQPVVTFCTGGIRCEKAAEYMVQKGFTDVYQLDGGILNYFDKCGGTHYEGDCFVFDKRVCLTPTLEVTDAQVCYSCRMPLQPGSFNPQDINCPLCGKSRFGKRHLALDESHESVKNMPSPSK